MTRNPNEYRRQGIAIDLFAGGGGLTVGLKEAGFSVISAVELNNDAADTYLANHPEVNVIKKDIRNVRKEDLLAGHTENVDLIAGCPPCQGFTSLTRKYDRIDPRNSLVKEMSRIVEEILPRIVMMENVPGLTERGKVLFQDFLDKLESLGYIVNYGILQVADYGVPQMRRRLVLLAGKGFKIGFPKSTHSMNGKDGLPVWKTVKDAIEGMERPLLYTKEIAKNGGGARHDWHIISDISYLNKQRYASQIPGETRRKIPKDLRPECHRDKDTGFSSAYGRLSWDSPSVTITSGFMTPSKGRFGHPGEHRALSLREGAALQTFPKDYKIVSKSISSACSIIGNALPCCFAEIMAKQCKEAIDKNTNNSSYEFCI